MSGAPQPGPRLPAARPPRPRTWLDEIAQDLVRLPGQVLDTFVLAARRLWANRRLFVGLQIGVIVAATVAATVPLYSNGALMRLLASTLQPENHRPAGSVMLRYVAKSGDNFTPDIQAKIAKLAQSIGAGVGIDETPPAFYMASQQEGMSPDPASPVPEDPSVTRAGFLEAEVGFDQHVTMLAGQMYSNAVASDGTVDAVVSQDTERNLQVVIGQTYFLEEPGMGNHVRVKIVGVYDRTDPTGAFWPYQFLQNDLVVSPAVFQSEFLYNSDLPLEEATWFTVLKLQQLAPSSALHLISALKQDNTTAGQIMPHTEIAISPLSELEDYASRLGSMQAELLLISLPILALTLYYVVMTAGLAIQQERNEIAVLVSRGARTWQILSLYMAEWAIIGAIAIVVAPFPAAVLTEIVGSSSGFLVFVNRQPLAIIPTATMYQYEVIAAVLALMAAMMPVFQATRESIISYKQEAARLMRAPFWRRAYVDVLLGLVAYYEWRQFEATNGAAAAAGANGGALAFEPLLYLIPAVFIAAAGLFIVRILPYVIRAIDRLIGRFAPLTFVLPARQLARTPTQFSPLIFLLVFTIALGYYSASAARTLDSNLADSLSYKVGSDLQLYEVWAPQGTAELGDTAQSAGLVAQPADTSGSATAPADAGTTTGDSTGAAGASSASGTGGGIQQFGGVQQAQGLQPGQTRLPSALLSGQAVAEPPFDPNLHLPGVISAARVFLEPTNIAIGGQQYPQQGQLMGISPPEFYQTTWWRNDLSPFTLRAYMIALANHYNGVLVSQWFLDKNALHPGNTISLAVQQGSGTFVILGPIDGWPGVADNGTTPLFVGNWDYIQNTYGVVPYFVWFRTKPNADYNTMVSDLEQQKLFATQPLDRRVLLGQAHADPQRTGSNGLLTIGFLVAALLTVLGYLLYALLSMRTRLLQFGLLRAMGLGRGALSLAVAVEQVFLIVAGVAGGLYVGDWAGYLFLPFFQGTTGGQMPPFVVDGPGPDLLRMGGILAILLGLAIVGLLQGLRGLRIGEAVKLGEE